MVVVVATVLETGALDFVVVVDVVDVAATAAIATASAASVASAAFDAPFAPLAPAYLQRPAAAAPGQQLRLALALECAVDSAVRDRARFHSMRTGSFSRSQ